MWTPPTSLEKSKNERRPCPFSLSRKCRAALTTPFRHRAVRPQPPAPTPEEDANVLDDLGDGCRCVVARCCILNGVYCVR